MKDEPQAWIPVNVQYENNQRDFPVVSGIISSIIPYLMALSVRLPTY